MTEKQIQDAPAAVLKAAAETPVEVKEAAGLKTPERDEAPVAAQEPQKTAKPTRAKTAKTSAAKKRAPAKSRAPRRTAQTQSDDVPPPLPPVTGVPDLNDPLLYINRELNWIEFDRKVLDEACDPKTPLLEQLKFLAIFHNNLDEFFMVRVANIIRQYKIGAPSTSADGLPPVKQLAEIRRRVLGMLTRAQNHWKSKLLPELAKKGINTIGTGIYNGLADAGDLKRAAAEKDRKSTRLNSSHEIPSRMPSSA